MRISAKERKENARQWYQRFINGYDTKIAIVVKRNDSTTNPNINRTQFFLAIVTEHQLLLRNLLQMELWDVSMNCYKISKRQTTLEITTKMILMSG